MEEWEEVRGDETQGKKTGRQEKRVQENGKKRDKKGKGLQRKEEGQKWEGRREGVKDIASSVAKGLKQYTYTTPTCLQILNDAKETPIEALQQARLYLGKMAMRRSEYTNAESFLKSQKISQNLCRDRERELRKE